MNTEIRECLACSICEFNAEHDCSYCEASRPVFCRAHYVQHLAGSHFGNRDAEERVYSLTRETKFPEGHPCKWHEGDTPILQDPDPEMYVAPGCSNCGTMYPTKDCEDTDIGKGCKLEFLDWEDKGFDDIMAGPYVTTSGDLYCQRCGPRMDEEEDDDVYEDDLYVDDDYYDE